MQSHPNNKPGILYVVATPIGNRNDITIRALDILGHVDLVAAEDTRHTGRLLSHHNIKCHMISFHEHNENDRTPDLINRLNAGASVALVSNAGTPSVSDPGYRLVKEAVIKPYKGHPHPRCVRRPLPLSVFRDCQPIPLFSLGFPLEKKQSGSINLKTLPVKAKPWYFMNLQSAF